RSLMGSARINLLLGKARRVLCREDSLQIYRRAILADLPMLAARTLKDKSLIPIRQMGIQAALLWEVRVLKAVASRQAATILNTNTMEVQTLAMRQSTLETGNYRRQLR